MHNSRPAAKAIRYALSSLLLTAVLFGGALLQTPSRAQSGGGAQAPQQASDASDVVIREGFTLKPSGLALNNLPTARFDFSVEKKDAGGKSVQFGALKASDIQVKLDDRPVKVSDSDLRLTSSEPTGVLIMIDGSGSMVGTKTVQLDKLSAAKSAVNTFINNLGQNDTVAIGAFDESPYWVADPTTNKSLLSEAVARYTIDPTRSKYTRLYQGAETAVRRAAEKGLRNVILISDGWEDSPESRQLSGAALSDFKSREEEKIKALSRDTGVRVYTIAIGDETGQGLAKVDTAALSNISKGTNGGDAVYICIPQQGTNDCGGETVTQDALEGKLKQTLDQIRQSSHYAYSLDIHLDGQIPRDPTHKLWIAPAVLTSSAAGERRRLQLPIEYYFRWPQGAHSGVVDEVLRLKPVVFIQTAPLTVPAGNLALLYLLMMMLLVSMGVIPLIVSRILHASRTSGAVTAVKARSQLVGKTCPNERSFGREYAFKQGDAVVVCPKCEETHHLACWMDNGQKCMKRVCEFPLQIPQTILSKHGVEASGLRTA